MSRRRRTVLQLGDSSKLHRYGYSKGFQSKESSVQGQPLTLVGDYSDSDSDGSTDQQVNQPPDEQGDKTPPVVPETTATSSIKNEGGETKSHMDDELRNFLSEIEAIPMPDEKNATDEGSKGSSPTPNQPTEESLHEERAETVTATSSKLVSGPSSKKTGAYSMFVKGSVEFVQSPGIPDVETEQSQQDKKEVNGMTDSDLETFPEEPVTQWQMVQDENTQYFYYWNWQTNGVTWEIPSDYTQYLLLHKEYKEKVAKLTPQQRQALLDRKAGKGKDTRLSSYGLSKVDREDDHKKSLSEDLIPSVKPIAGSGVDDNSRSSSHHHKKKKSKKHKRKHDDSDGEMDEGIVRNESLATRGSGDADSVKKSKMIGPQALSIVPYMSDNDDDEEEEEDEKERDLEDLLSLATSSNLEPELSEDKITASPSPLPSPQPISQPAESKPHAKPNFEALVQTLVEFHDSMTPSPSESATPAASTKTTSDAANDLNNIEGGDETANEKTTEEVKIVVETARDDNEEKELRDNAKLEEGRRKPDNQVIKEESELATGTLEILGGDASSKDMKKTDNIFELFAVKKEVKKKKKKMINMFADDSQSENEKMDDNTDADSKKISDTTLKVEMEEGELSDGLESVSKDIHFQKAKKLRSDLNSNEKVNLRSEKPVSSSLKKGIVGYSEEDEEEEGELKEDESRCEVKTTKLSEQKEKTDGNREVKKKVLQYNDYKKKYGCGKISSKATINSDGIELGTNVKSSVDESSLPVQSVPVEDPSVRGSNDNQPVVQAEEEKKAVVKDEEEKEFEDTEDLDFDDLDNIDRVLEMALQKKREQKTESKQEDDKITSEIIESKPSSPPAEIKAKTEAESDESVRPVSEASGMSETDMKMLKYTVKDSAELALHKLQFLDISTKNLSKLQVLLVELQTRYNDWQAGGLSTSYFHSQLQSSEALLSQYEESAVPSGWLCQWDRASCRYFYRHKHSDHTQWEYPQPGGGDSSATSSKANNKTEVKDVSSSSSRRSGKKRRSKDTEERDESVTKSRGINSSRTSRSHRSKKNQEKDRGKRDRHSSSTHHHRKKKRRRRDHSSSSSSSEDESTQSSSRHRRSRSKRKKRGRSDKSPSLEVIDLDGPEPVHVIEESPPPSIARLNDSLNRPIGTKESRNDSRNPEMRREAPDLVADYGSELDLDEEKTMDEDEVVEEEGRKRVMEQDLLDADGKNQPAATATVNAGEFCDKHLGGGESIDGEEMKEEDGEDGAKEEEEEEEGENNAVIIRPPQITVPPYVAAINEPQMYSATSLYASAPSSMIPAAPPVGQENEGEATQVSEEADKAGKKKKKEKSGKEKSLSANSSIMMKKKRVSSMVQKWQQVKKEVEKENRDKELRQAAIREKINQLKNT